MVNLRSFLLAATALLPFAAALPTHTASDSVTIQAGSVVADNYIVLLKPSTTEEEFDAHQVHSPPNIPFTTTNTRRYGPRTSIAAASPAATTQVFPVSILSGTSESWQGTRGLSITRLLSRYISPTPTTPPHMLTSLQIKARNEVELVEEDKVVVASDIQTQRNATWGIARVSQGKTFRDSTYRFDSSAGQGVTVYVIDTGINAAHVDFEGRATLAHNAAGGSDQDGQGHGTHVAGTIAGKTFGIAKKAEIKAVKVLGDNGQGTNSAVIAGVEFVAQDAKGKKGGSVANMSLGGAFSQAVNRAVEAAIESGVTFCVAVSPSPPLYTPANLS